MSQENKSISLALEIMKWLLPRRENKQEIQEFIQELQEIQATIQALEPDVGEGI